MFPLAGAIALQIVLLVAVLGVCVFMLNKLHKVDDSTRALAVYATRIGQETHAIFPQIQALMSLERRLRLAQALPPMRGWAGSPDFLLRVAQEVENRTPHVIVECGSGISTLVCARTLQLNGHGHVYSLEHDPRYAERTAALLKEYQLNEWATVIHAPLNTEHTVTPWYAEAAIPQDITNIDLVIVDGPPSTIAHFARYPALPRLADRMSGDVIVIVDDAARSDEQEMLRMWAHEFPAFSQTYADCEKGCALLVRSERSA